MAGYSKTGALATAAAAVAAHEAAGNPHPTYTTEAEATTIADTQAAAAVATHAAAGDPHTGYQLESEKGAASGYAGLGSDSRVPEAQSAQKISTITFMESSTTAPVWTAQPSATTEFNGNVNRRRHFDATNFTQVRIETKMTTAGASGATLGAQFSLDGGSTWVFADGSADGDLGSEGPQVTIDSTTAPVISDWTTLHASARADALWRIIGDGGNGATSPVFNYVILQFR